MENIRLDTSLEVIKKEIRNHYLASGPQETLPGDEKLGAMSNTRFNDWLPFLKPLVESFYSVDHINLWNDVVKMERAFNLVAAGIKTGTIKMPEAANQLIDLIHVFNEEIDIRTHEMAPKEKTGELGKVDQEIEEKLNIKHGDEEAQNEHNEQFAEEVDELQKEHQEEMMEQKEKPLDEKEGFDGQIAK